MAKKFEWLEKLIAEAAKFAENKKRLEEEKKKNKN